MSLESSPGHPGVPFKDLIPNNQRWATDVLRREPDFFRISAQGQSPKTLWIGCSDSRVPESVITGSKPGDIFVQRNIANLFHLDDTNAQSVLSYAVKHLKVKHVVVVGHSHCGGCKAALIASRIGPNARADEELPYDAPINTWLAPLVKFAWFLQRRHQTPLSLDSLVVANIRAQVKQLKKCSTIMENKDVEVTGLIYYLEEGRLLPLISPKFDEDGETIGMDTEDNVGDKPLN